MPITKPLDEPGRGRAPAPATPAFVPDAVPRFGPILAKRWLADNIPLARAHPDARFRHSDAGACARRLGYAALDLPPSNPMDEAGHWVTNLGKRIHELWQDEMEATYGDAVECEVKVHEGRRAGHIDAVVRTDVMKDGWGMPRPWVTAIEYKSAGGFKYKLAVGERGDAEGPDYSHIVQAALNAKAIDADEAVIIYGARDVVSIQAAARKPNIDEQLRYSAEWTLTRQQYEPIAQREIERVEAILAMVDEGQLPARKIPNSIPRRALIIDPSKGTWVEYDQHGERANSGSTWECPYCPYRDLCSRTKPGRMPIDELPQ